jgi:hypothetical protein
MTYVFAVCGKKDRIGALCKVRRYKSGALPVDLWSNESAHRATMLPPVTATLHQPQRQVLLAHHTVALHPLPTFN